jgi:hypothetical protein
MQGSRKDVPTRIRWFQRIATIVLLGGTIGAVWVAWVFHEGMPPLQATLSIGAMVLVAGMVFGAMAMHPHMKGHDRWMVSNRAVYLDNGVTLPLQKVARVRFGIYLETTEGQKIALGWMPDRWQATNRLRQDIQDAQVALARGNPRGEAHP